MYDRILAALAKEPKTWCVTGVAGFIGSNLLEGLLAAGQSVVGLDNFSTGKRANLEEVCALLPEAYAKRFTLIEGDIRDPGDCERACRDADFVLHQAAIGSVPRSVENPDFSNDNNVTGTLRMLDAARKAGVKRFVYASSSSVYGDHPALPKVEDVVGAPLSPYAVTKRADELYAGAFANVYGLGCVGLRYFNVFGPRQDPEGAYAAVIPKWVASLLAGEPVFINGSGEISRDFCYVDNVVQVNILAATAEHPEAVNQAYNVAVGRRTTLEELFAAIRDALVPIRPDLAEAAPSYRDFRPGDIHHSLADIGKAQRLLGYAPRFTLETGLARAISWYVKNLS